MKVYKGVTKDLRGYGDFQYEVGKTYETENPDLCSNGFHGCEAPLDVLRHYPLKNGNRYFEAELEGVTDQRHDDTKRVGSKVTLGAEIGLAGLIKAQISYTREKAESGTKCGYESNLAGGDGSNLAGGNRSNLAGGNGSNLAGGDWSNLAGGNRSNLAGGNRSNLAGGYRSNLAGGYRSNLAGGDWSNLAGGYESNLAGGDWSNLAGGDWSNLAGGNRSNLAGGDGSNLAGGDRSVIVAGNGSRAKAGMGSVIVLVKREYVSGEWKITDWKAGVVDGVNLKPDVWYKLENGEFVEAEE